MSSATVWLIEPIRQAVVETVPEGEKRLVVGGTVAGITGIPKTTKALHCRSNSRSRIDNVFTSALPSVRAVTYLRDTAPWLEVSGKRKVNGFSPGS